MFRWMKWWLAVASLSLMAGCWSDSDDDRPGTLAEVAQAQNFGALLAAAEKAGLASVLADADAELTVFAPTDAAFAALAQRLGFASATAMVEALPADALAKVLSYHVLPTVQRAADLAAGGPTQPTLYSFEGAAATLALDASSGVRITDAVLTQATVTTADVAASNGVIHVIDKVLVPPGVLNIVQMAQANPAFDALVSAVVAADLQGALSGAGPLTVFAPVNAAFEAIADVAATLTTEQLAAVLSYHVLGSQVLSADLPAAGVPVDTLLTGQTISFGPGVAPILATITDTTATPAGIVAVDVRASNGVIHVIDKVLLPDLGS